MRDDAAAQDATENRTVHCRYNTDLFAIGIKHTVFFLKNETESICSVRHEPLDLSQHCEFYMTSVNNNCHITVVMRVIVLIEYKWMSSVVFFYSVCCVQ